MHAVDSATLGMETLHPTRGMTRVEGEGIHGTYEWTDAQIVALVYRFWGVFRREFQFDMECPLSVSRPLDTGSRWKYAERPYAKVALYVFTDIMTRLHERDAWEANRLFYLTHLVTQDFVEEGAEYGVMFNRSGRPTGIMRGGRFEALLRDNGIDPTPLRRFTLVDRAAPAGGRRAPTYACACTQFRAEMKADLVARCDRCGSSFQLTRD